MHTIQIIILLVSTGDAPRLELAWCGSRDSTRVGYSKPLSSSALLLEGKLS